MRCCTRSPTRCSAPRRWATSAATFPTPTQRFAGADSVALLAEAARRVRAAGWQIVNVDTHHRRAGAEDGAAHRGHARSASPPRWRSTSRSVNVKAKTAEKMGPVGEGRAIEARAVCLLQCWPR